MPTPPINPSLATDPVAALQALAGATGQQQQDAAALNSVVSNKMIQQYAGSQAKPQASVPRQSQGPIDTTQQQAIGPQQAAQHAQAPPFRMVPVSSSTLHQVGYDYGKRELHIQFRSGPDVYVYSEVSPKAYDELMNAKSKGLQHAQKIKGHYPFQKVKPVPPQL